ncbi:unnamed protein product, partial [Allacma fusca]
MELGEVMEYVSHCDNNLFIDKLRTFESQFEDVELYAWNHINNREFTRFGLNDTLNDCHESEGIFPSMFPKGWQFCNPKADTLMNVLNTLVSSGIFDERALLLVFQIKTAAKRIQYFQPDNGTNTLYSL